MKEITLKLDDIVVIGYGIIRKQDLTGSVGLVPVKDLAKAPVSSFAEALAGRLWPVFRLIQMMVSLAAELISSSGCRLANAKHVPFICY